MNDFEKWLDKCDFLDNEKCFYLYSNYICSLKWDLCKWLGYHFTWCDRLNLKEFFDRRENMKNFLELLNLMWPTDYVDKRKYLVENTFTKDELEKIEIFLKRIKKLSFDEMENV